MPHMTIRLNVLGYTLASIDVDLGGLLGDQPATAAPAGPPAVNRLVKRVSNGWVRRMMAAD